MDLTVAIAGVGNTGSMRAAPESITDLGARAAVEALRDAGQTTTPSVDAVYVANVYGGSVIGQRIMRQVGLTEIPIVNVENACASGSTALHEACWAVSSGRYRKVLVLGVEMLSSLGSGTLPLDEEDYEVRQGVTMPAVYAMRARRYMHDYGVTEKDLALVAVKNRRDGAKNADAWIREEVAVGDVLSSRMIADPLNLLQCCANTDAAAALVVTDVETARHSPETPVRVAGSALTSGRFTNKSRDMTWLDVSERAADRAYDMSDYGPSDIDVVELHNPFTIAELIYSEVLGFAEPGTGSDLVRDVLDGDNSHDVPAINPSGGLLAKGHPVGATGVAQVVEIVRQLRGQAGEGQIHRAMVGLTHNAGGGIWGYDSAAAGVHIMSVD